MIHIELRAPVWCRKFYNGWEERPHFNPRASGAVPTSWAADSAPAGRRSHRARPAAALTGPLWEKRKKPKRRREEVGVALRPIVFETVLVSGWQPESDSTGHAGCPRKRGFARRRDDPGWPGRRGAGNPGEAALVAWGGDTGDPVRWHRSPRGDCFSEVPWRPAWGRGSCGAGKMALGILVRRHRPPRRDSLNEVAVVIPVRWHILLGRWSWRVGKETPTALGRWHWWPQGGSPLHQQALVSLEGPRGRVWDLAVLQWMFSGNLVWVPSTT